ncbi:unnamed protein product [Caenorhabditis bovis]|uniref:Forkhead box protein O n=1 Tax=Caenorhabditis bovis TaxID=2654633 RepID=A0A8S1F4I9_9PELO|nr:unnamed protein product [Caenorhabditis bovis]
MDGDFSSEPRGRCYTWPMQQYMYEHPMSVPPSQMPTPTQMSVMSSPPAMMHHQMPNVSIAPCSSGMSGGGNAHVMPLGMNMPMSQGGGPMPVSAKKKRCRKKPSDQLAQKKPNPWGEESYSDIIAKALETAPEGRLKLSEIYQWFSDNIQYFRERSSQEEAAGWKNSIRHNLSLHSRFMRVQNEGAGKSSWWVINPEAKPGRNPRRTRERSNTIETTSKVHLDKTRRGARKRVKERGLIGNLHATINGSQASIVSHDLYEDESMQGNFDFRGRTQSNLSVPASSSRVSPNNVDHSYEEFDFPTWVDSAAGVPQIPNDIVDRTDQMRIDAARHLNGNQTNMIKQEMKPVKTESIVPPPSYHTLNSVRGPCVQNPLLRNPIAQTTKYHPMPIPTYSSYNNSWTMPTPTLPNIQSCGAVAAQQQSVVSSSSALPIDLENLTLPDQPLMDMDVESIIRHELSQNQQQLSFDW